MRYLMVLSLFLVSIAYSAQEADSLVDVLRTAKGKQRVSILNDLVADLGYYYPDSAKAYSKEALSLAKKYGDDSTIAATIHTGIYPYLGSGQYKEYQTSLKYAVELWRKLNLVERELSTLNNLAVLELYSGDIDAAMNTVLTSIKIAERVNDTVSVAENYMLLSSILSENENRTGAIKYLRKALPIFKTLERKPDLGRLYANLGNNFEALGETDSAKHYLFKGMGMFKAINDPRELAKSYHNIGTFFEDEPDSSIFYLQKGLTLHLLTNDSLLIGNTYSALSTQSQKNNELTNALIFAEKAVAYTKTQYLEERINALAALSEVTYRLNDFKRTSELKEEIIFLQDSLYEMSKDEKVEELKTQYETEKKEQQIRIQNASLAKKESELKANQRTIIALMVFVLLILVVVFAAYKRYQAKRNAELQQKIIEEQERGLKAVFNAQEEERKRISRELHDGIGQQLSALKMAIQSYGSTISEDEKERIEKLAKIASDSADEVRSISHQMMPITLTEMGLVEALENMFSQSLAVNNIEYEFEQHQIDERLSELTEISLYRICQELVNNITKHAKATQVNIQLFKNAGKVILIVEDNGTGIKKKSTEGHGLLNIKSRINTLSGELSFSPSPNSGTLVTIRIPL